MNLKRVTITGADGLNDISELLDLSEEFPFVEWGILVSSSHSGVPRFPSTTWIDRFVAAAEGKGLNISTHVCGKWVRELLVGELDWNKLPSCVGISQRIQINTHAGRHHSTRAMIDNMAIQANKEFIFQWDGVNDHLTYAARAYGLRVAALFDTSGGAGILPETWPEPINEFWCGYAGGLGPMNVIDQLIKIREVCKNPFWIDMEGRVRTPDDLHLDMEKVQSVLSQVRSTFPWFRISDGTTKAVFVCPHLAEIGD